MAEPLQFQIGGVSQGAAVVLAAGIAIYAVITTIYAFRGFEARLEDRWSAAAAAAVMFALAMMVYVFGAKVFPAPFSIWIIVIMAFGAIFTLTYTLGRYQERIDKFREESGARLRTLLAEVVPEERYAELLRLREQFSLDAEERRKTPHLLMGLVLLTYAGLGLALLRAFWETAYGGTGVDAGEGVHNLFVASHQGWFFAGHVMLLVVLLLILLVIAPTEMLRLRYPELSYPLKTVILSRLRDREKGLFGAHYYIAAAAPAAAFWLTRRPEYWDLGIPAVIALLAITVFADAASALVGKNWGKRKWPHHPGKSYLGTFGGAVVALVLSFAFVGPIMAVAGALTFALVDIIGPKPIPISDNILNPVALSICYTVGWNYLQPLIPLV